jgi:NitT/TauT family transport system substrate-binding protein
VWRELAVAACTVAVTLAGAGAAAAEKLVVAYSLSTSSVPLLAAYEKGWFREEGLELELTPQASGPKALELIHLGQVQLGSPASINLITAAARGANVMAVATNGIYDRSNPQQALVVKADGPVKALRDLDKRVVAVNGYGTHGDIVLRMDVFPGLGLQPGRNVTVIEMPWSQMEGALVNGRIDAGLVFEPFVARLRTNKEVRILSLLEDSIPPDGYMVSLLTMPRSFVQANPETVKRLLRGFARGIQLMKTNREEATSLWNKYGKLPPEVMKAVHLHAYTDDGGIPAKLVQSMAEKMKAGGLIERVPDLETYVWGPAIRR